MGIEDDGGGRAAHADVLVVTTNDVPGHQVTQVIGEVFKTLVETRNQAMERLVEQAKARGANAVLMMRFDVTEAADVGTEVCAYGTAAVINKI